MDVDSIGELLGGRKFPVSTRIDSIFGNGQCVVNAFLIGQESRDIDLYPEKWADLGNKEDLFRYIKQIWHTVGFFG